MHATFNSNLCQPIPVSLASQPWELPLAEKLSLVKHLRIAFPAFQDAVDEITEMVQLGDCALGFNGAFIIGESGSGKTTLLETIAARYPSFDIEDRTIKPCVMTKVPSTPSIKSIARRILKALGDPLYNAARRDNSELTEGIIQLLKKCDTKVLLLDEINNFIQKKGRHDSVLDLSNWIKEIVELSGVLIVLAGLPSAEVITRSNIQLRRRFSAPQYLDLVKKSHKRQNLTNFKGVLKAVDEKLPTQQISGLHEESLCWRLFFATDGLIGILMKLLRRSIRIAHKKEAPRIDLAILEEAFIKELWPQGTGPLNPFNADFVKRRLDQVGEPYGPEAHQDSLGGRQ